MPDPTVEKLIGQIHAGPGQMVLAVTGGGSQAIADLLSVPGGSRTVLEAVVPYSASAMVDLLHGEPEHFCSARTARCMAMAAFERARRLQFAEHGRPDGNTTIELASPVFGIGCTASLASDRPKRGPHRIHVACQSATTTTVESIELIKGHRARSEEESVGSRLILNMIADALAIDERLPILLMDKESIERQRTDGPQPWQNLMLGHSIAVYLAPGERDGVGLQNPPYPPWHSGPPRAVFPGAFNPLHDGHLRMSQLAARILGTPVHFEMSIENVDKPLLDYYEMRERADQFVTRSSSLWFTRAPTFDQKSAIFPGATFIVGADTLLRIAHCKYYGNDPATAEASIARIAQRGCRFLVFGRMVEGKFETLADLELPDSLRKLCDEVPAGEFREDISSTEIRGRAT